MGRAPRDPDPDHYEHRHAHCDVLVIGGGPGGPRRGAIAPPGAAHGSSCATRTRRSAAVFAAPRRRSTAAPPASWIAACVDELAAPTAMSRCCRARPRSAITIRTWSAWSSASPIICPRRRRSRRASGCGMCARGIVVLASGALERGIAYAGNDLPGTMLAGAAQATSSATASSPERAPSSSPTTTAPTARRCALHDAGVDRRRHRRCAAASGALRRHPQRARAAGIPISPGSAIVRAHGRLRVAGVDRRYRSAAAQRPRVDCDLVCVSGGWNPAVHLYSQSRGKLRYDDALATFVPDAAPQAIVAAGAANGKLRPRCRASPMDTPQDSPPRAGRLRRARKARRAGSRRCVDAGRCCRCGRCRRARGAKCFVDLAERRDRRRHRARARAKATARSSI